MSNLLINLAFIPTKPTGHAVYANNLFPALRDRNPILLTPYETPEFRTHRISNKMNPDYGSKGHLRRLLWNEFRLPQLCKKLQGSLLFSPIPEMPLLTRCRSVVTLHDVIPLRFKRRSPLTPYFQHYIPQVLRRAQHIICNSEATARDAVDYYQIPASKLTVIPMAYDRDHFRVLNLPKGNYFLFLGRPDAYKNIGRTIAAFAQLKTDRELWIAGPYDARYSEHLVQQATELGVIDRVKFLNYVPYSELPKLINSAVALVFPSLWEGFGFPALEAMACGTPVITSDLASLPEVTGDAAILVDPYSVEAIAQAMDVIDRDPSLCAELRQRGLVRSQQFSWEKTGAMTVGVLDRYL
jgi:glycosyltransferase involved in cell wall biosynthesis